jgi:hypothetical protein
VDSTSMHPSDTHIYKYIYTYIYIYIHIYSYDIHWAVSFKKWIAQQRSKLNLDSPCSMFVTYRFSDY